MAQIPGGLAASHIPPSVAPSHKGPPAEPCWKPFFDGFPAHQRLAGQKSSQMSWWCSTTTTA